MESVIQKIEARYKKKAIPSVQSGDTVRVRQKIREGDKERIQNFEGLVIRTSRPKSLTASITVRRTASGVGVEKTFPMHATSITKIEVIKRSKVRRNYLSYMRKLSGKGSRLSGVDFDREAVNAVGEEAEAEEAKIKEEQAEQHEAEAAKEAEAEAKTEAKVEEAMSKHDEAAKPEAKETSAEK